MISGYWLVSSLSTAKLICYICVLLLELTNNKLESRILIYICYPSGFISRKDNMYYQQLLKLFIALNWSNIVIPPDEQHLSKCILSNLKWRIIRRRQLLISQCVFRSPLPAAVTRNIQSLDFHNFTDCNDFIHDLYLIIV